MKNIVRNTGISLAACLLGCVFFAWYHGYIMLMIPGGHTFPTTQTQHAYKKKTVTLVYYTGRTTAQENIDILWPQETSEQVTMLVSAWLTLINEHDILSKKVSLESVACSNGNTELIISFDRNLFEKQMSAYTKLMLIETVLTTLRQQEINAQAVRFLVHHKPMSDTHLDFSRAWPLIGFVQQRQ